MIGRVAANISSAPYREFAERLAHSGFRGEVSLDYAERTVQATDNSIYQLAPQGILYPLDTADVARIFTLASEDCFQQLTFFPRGGATGTNGQSLGNGFVVDTSRHMTRIVEINIDERWARVQCGVVKDQLDGEIRRNGLFFAPELSTSNRATLGGMVNTDASGQGSVVHGKTRHHLLEITSVLTDGTVWTSSPLVGSELDAVCRRSDRVGVVHRVVDRVYRDHSERIEAVFPRLDRNMTGYDLAHIRGQASIDRTSEKSVDLNAILCGSEGTLAVVTEIKVRLTPLPAVSALVLIFYTDFLASLSDARVLLSASPDSIETIDSKVLGQARAHPSWSTVGHWFAGSQYECGVDQQCPPDGINFVELTGDSHDALQAGLHRLKRVLEEHPDPRRLGYRVVTDAQGIHEVWTLRKQAVGLLGSVKGDARPIAFVEDVAVPPEQLHSFISRFRELLDRHHLTYGMFGHVDAGVLHVRPAIDMKDRSQEGLVRQISDEVAQLAKKHGGVLWGEHGKGMRSEYAPLFFEELYPLLEEIKGAFDPFNQLNPGKVATPGRGAGALLKIDQVPTRGQQDRSIERNAFEVFSGTLYCNGNGACFNFDPNSAMCPTWKATRDRKQSPKGRSALVREWLRMQGEIGADVTGAVEAVKTMNPLSRLWIKFAHLFEKNDFGLEVYRHLDSCMSCKSCAGQCPLQVNVPDLRSRYFELHHTRYFRPLKHYAASMLESMLPWFARIKGVYNRAVSLQLVDRLMARGLGLQSLPRITSSSPVKECRRAGADVATVEKVRSMSESERDRTVVIVQDAFTSFFETNLLVDLIELLVLLGFRPLLAQFKPNGKVQHVFGFLRQFKRIASANSRQLKQLEESGVALVGVDPAVTLTYRDEYWEFLGEKAPTVKLLSEWFDQRLAQLNPGKRVIGGTYRLLGHCTEKTNVPESVGQWQRLYQTFGIRLDHQPVGCCGMAGIFGHESERQDVSRELYQMSWQPVVDNIAFKDRLVATGYSCRSQAKRFGSDDIPHPISTLLRLLKAAV